MASSAETGAPAGAVVAAKLHSKRQRPQDDDEAAGGSASKTIEATTTSSTTTASTTATAAASGDGENPRPVKRKKTKESSARRELRVALQNACKEDDCSAALAAYEKGKAANTPMDTQMFAMMLNLCATNNRPKDATRLFEEAKSASIKIAEPGYSCLIKAVGLAGDGDRGLAVLREMIASGVKPRIRSYSPLVQCFGRKGTPEGVATARSLLKEMQGRGLDATEPDFVALAAGVVAAGEGKAAFDSVLTEAMDLVYTLSPDSLATLQQVFDGYQRGGCLSPCPVVAPHMNQVGSHVLHRFEGWKTATVEVDKTGTVDACGRKLRSIDLEPDEYTSLCKQTTSLASRSKKTTQQFQEFNTWLDKHGPFDIIVDGANVGYLNQNHDDGFFDHAQIEDVVAHYEKLGKRVLLVIHKHWLTPTVDLRAHWPGELGVSAEEMKMLRQRNAKLCEGWKKRRVAYLVTKGNNDDWYWLYAAVKFGAFVVSNDQMRDHNFQMLAPRHFFKWRERHQIKFGFLNSRSKEDKRPWFQLPPRFSHRMHPDVDKSAWFLPAAEDDKKWLVAWDTRSAPVATPPPAAASASTGASSGGGAGGGAGAGAADSTTEEPQFMY